MIPFAHFGGMLLIFAGERLFGDAALHWPLTGLGVVLVLAAAGVRAARMSGAEKSQAGAHKSALALHAVALLALALYAASNQAEALGLDEEAAKRWSGSLSAIWMILWLVSAIPLALLDWMITQHPVQMPIGAARRAIRSGVGAALGIALVFPLNYLGSQHKTEWDVAYFKVAQPGTSTLAIAGNLSEKVDIYLFYAPGNAVKESLVPYFEAVVAAAPAGMLELHVVDQPMAPDLSEKFKIRNNGNIVFVKGDNEQKFRVDDDFDRAKKDLKKLDSLVQKHLLKTLEGSRSVYVMGGHGEASHRERENLLYKLSSLRTIVQNANYKYEEFALADGTTDAVPEDAAMVIVAGPDKDLMPEEHQVLQDYLNRGGSLFVLVEPGREKLDPLLASLGLVARTELLANAANYVKQTRGPADRVLLFSNRFGTHEAVSTLSKNSTSMAVILPTVVAIEEVPGFSGKVTALVRSFPDTWNELNNNRVADPDETSQVWTMAWASEGPERADGPPFRAVVVGDVSAISDAMMGINVGNQQFALDVVRWLSRDEAIVGEVSSEEDVKIAHTREEDQAWFYGTVFGVPLLILVGGIAFTTMRRKS